LRALEDTFRRYVTDEVSSWADFGCSNGFVISSLLSTGFKFDRIVGYDHSRRLLSMAEARNLENASFLYREMNESPPLQMAYRELYDLVTCFETLEHVADYRRSFEHLFASAIPGGLIVVAVPNETGWPGFAKLWARRVARRNPDGDFFEDNSLAQYTMRLITGAYIDDFRAPSPTGYGPHLGFDYRRLIEHIESTYVETGGLSLLEQSRTLFGMNIVLVYRVAERAT